MNDEHVVDLIPAYALGCLDSDELDQVEAHLAQCGMCSQEWTSYQVVLNNLASSPSQVNPPRYLKQSILKATGLSQARLPLRQPGRTFNMKGARRLGTWQTWVRSLLPAWGIASLVLLIGLGITNVLLWQQVQSSPQPGNIVFSDFQIVSLAGTSAAPQANGILVISRDGLAGSLNVDGLQPLGSAYQYQLWLIDQGKRTSGGVFSVDPQGYGSLKVNSPRPLIEFGSFGITIEPAGGSPGPTGDKVLGGNL